MRVRRSVEKLLCSPLCLNFGCSPTLAKSFLYGCVLRCRRIQEDGPSLMLFDRHRSTASDGFTAARNERCQFTHAPGLANQAMPHARLKVSCGRNWFWAAARASAARLFPARRHRQAQHPTSCVHGISRCAPRSSRAKNAASSVLSNLAVSPRPRRAARRWLSPARPHRLSGRGSPGVQGPAWWANDALAPQGVAAVAP